jgi:hypothetical protein
VVSGLPEKQRGLAIDNIGTKGKQMLLRKLDDAHGKLDEAHGKLLQHAVRIDGIKHTFV